VNCGLWRFISVLGTGRTPRINVVCMGRVCKNVAIFVGYCVSWRLFRQYLFQALAFGACAIYKAARRKFKV